MDEKAMACERYIFVTEKAITYETVKRHTVPVHPGKLDCPQQAMLLLEPIFKKSPVENLYAVAINSSNDFLGLIKLAQGTVGRASVYPRELLSFLLVETNATAVILAHNHPGGRQRPSDEDLRFTRRLDGLLDALEVNLLDHLIYTPEILDRECHWFSMKQDGLI